MVSPLPSATFGKPEGANAYQVIHQDAEFDAPELASALRRICGSFEWKPNQSGLQYRPCHGLLRVGDLLLMAKFGDTGRDATGRPHTLRIECLIARQDEIQVAWDYLRGPGAAVPPIPDDDRLQIVGDPDTFWSSTDA